MTHGTSSTSSVAVCSLARELEARYGTRRGWLRHIGHRLAWRWTCGPVIDPSRPVNATRLVFVCQGNICRSALAEAVARAHGIDARSYGLDTVVGKPADRRMVDLARELGYDLGAHRATPIDGYQPRPGDLILLMEPEHLRRLSAMAPSLHVPVGLLGLWARPRRPYIHDPFAAGDAYMRHCALAVAGAVTNLGSRLKQTDV